MLTHGDLQLMQNVNKKIELVENTNDPSTSVGTLTFSFLVPSTVVQNKKVGSLKLRSLDKTKDYAILILDDVIELGSNENMLIEWTLTISNSTLDVMGETV